MWDKTKRAIDTMKERNRRYLEEQKKKDEAGREENPQPDHEDPDSPQDPSCEDSSCEDPSCEDPSSEDLSPEEKAAAFHEKEQLKLEKGDLPAMILSAIMVFGPVFLVLIAILVLVGIFLH